MLPCRSLPRARAQLINAGVVSVPFQATASSRSQSRLHRKDAYPSSLLLSPSIAAGLNEDGYEAIQFAIDNVPFRNDPRIARNMLLITDEGRTVIPQGRG